jgi:histidyl-tRNA synthetase
LAICRQQQQQQQQQKKVDVLVASVGKGMLAQRMKAAKELWKAGVSAEFVQNKENPKFGGPGSQLAYALDLEVAVVVIWFCFVKRDHRILR